MKKEFDVKMRLLEIDISCSDRSVSEIVGIDNYDNDVPSRCVIDLNRVSSVWASPDEGICIHLGSHEESYWTKTYTLSEFTALWRGSEVGAAIPSPLPPPTKKAADV
jgi:hypothetical protein